MKKYMFLITSLFLLFTLSACNLTEKLNELLDELTTDTTDTTTKPNITYPDNYEDLIIPNTISTYKDINKSLNYCPTYLPTIGNPKILVVPVNFKDANIQYNEEIVSDLEKVFFDDGENLEWESVKSYYKKSSYGKLELDGSVSDIVYLKNNTDYYQYYDENMEATTIDFKKLVPEIMETIDKNYNLEDYDYDKDKVIDGIYFVYNQDVYKKETDNKTIYRDKNGYYELNDEKSFWAWVSWYNDTNLLMYDDVELYHYMWVGLDFMYYRQDIDTYLPSLGDTYLNSETFIHETGHMMGADDYYDYSEGEAGSQLGIGGADMMDANYGDHNPVTKILFGWIKPTIIVSGSHTIDLSGYSKNGECVIICKSYDEETNILREFFIIDFYDNKGLNADNYFKQGHYYYDDDNNKVCEGFNTNGIRIYYVNANIDKENSCGDYYTSHFTYDNSDEDYAFITLVDAYSSNKVNQLLKTDIFVDEKCLFKQGESFIPNNLCSGYKSNWDFNIEVIKIDEENNKATINIVVD